MKRTGKKKNNNKLAITSQHSIAVVQINRKVLCLTYLYNDEIGL